MAKGKLRIDSDEVAPVVEAQVTLLAITEGPRYRFNVVEATVPASKVKTITSGLDRQRAMDAFRLKSNALWMRGAK